MNPFRQDAAHSLGKWSTVTETVEGDLGLYIDGAKVEPSQEELELINSKALELEVEAKANSYKSLRAEEYARLNQFELMFDDQQNGTNHWPDAINEIKDKYPKPI